MISTASTEVAMPENLITTQDFSRLETKVDKLADAMQQLIRVEERQTNQGVRLGGHDVDIATLKNSHNLLEKKVDQWINRVIGAWAIATFIWAAVQYADTHGLITLTR